MFAQPAGHPTSSGTGYQVGPENKTGIFEIDVDNLEVRTYSYPSQITGSVCDLPGGQVVQLCGLLRTRGSHSCVAEGRR